MSKARIDLRIQYAAIDLIDRIRCLMRGHEYDLVDNGHPGIWYQSALVCITCGRWKEDEIGDDMVQNQIDAALGK